MEGQVARARARIQFGEGRVVRSEGSFGRVETIDQDLIKPEIGSKGKTIVGRGCNPVRVRGCLAFFVDAGAVMLDEISGLA